MKKLFNLLSVLSIIALVAVSCSKDEGLIEPVSEQSQVSFSVNVPTGLQTRAIGDGNTVNELHYEVYYDGATTPIIDDVVSQSTAGVNPGEGSIFTVSFPLVKQQEYTILFWAQNSNNGVYDPANLTQVKVDYTKTVANKENLDAFYAAKTFVVESENLNQTITLTRPFGQLNLGTSKESTTEAARLGVSASKTKIIVSSLPTCFNVANGAATQPAENVEFVFNTLPEEKNITVELSGNDVTFDYLSFNYLLLEATQENILVDLNAQIELNDGNIIEHKISALPVQRNYRTNIVGNLLTSNTNFKIVVDNRFNEPAKAVTIWDGKTVVEPSVVDGKYIITNSAEFAWLQAPRVLAYDIELASTIDMGGYPVKGILSNGKTLDGKGYTIQNVTFDYTSSQPWSSLFVTGGGNGNNSKVNVKNLTLYKAKSVGGKNDNGNSAIIASYVENVCNIENVLIKECEIQGTQSLGAFIGHVTASGNATIKDSKVEDVTVTTFDVTNESGNAGTVVGRVTGQLTMENTSVDGGVINAYVNRANDERTISKYIGNFYGSGASIKVINGSTKNVTINALNTLAETEQCKYTDYLGGWRKDGGTVEINGVNLTKGSSIQPDNTLAPVNGVYEINDINDMLALSGINLTQESTININNDIDMLNMEFKGISAHYTKVTVNGNRKTIKNVNVVENAHNNGTDAASIFFASVNSELNVSDLTFDNINVIAPIGGNGYAGVLVGYNQGATTVKNVVVKNSSVYGEKSCGGIIGFAEPSGSVVLENCRVENTTVEAKEDRTGAWIGRVYSPTTITNCTVGEGFVSIAPDGDANKFIGQRYVGVSSCTVDGAEYFDKNTQTELATYLKNVNATSIKVVLGTNVDCYLNDGVGGANTTEISIYALDKKYILNITCPSASYNGSYCTFRAVNPTTIMKFNNITLNKTAWTAETWNTYNMEFYTDVELDNCVIEHPITVCTKASIKNSTINGFRGTADHYAIWQQANGTDLSLENCVVNGTRGIKISMEYITPLETSLSVSNTKFVTSGSKGAILVETSAATNINLSRVDISNVAADKVNPVWVDADAAAYFNLVNVSGGSKIQE